MVIFVAYCSFCWGNFLWGGLFVEQTFWLSSRYFGLSSVEGLSSTVCFSIQMSAGDISNHGRGWKIFAAQPCLQLFIPLTLVSSCWYRSLIVDGNWWFGGVLIRAGEVSEAVPSLATAARSARESVTLQLLHTALRPNQPTNVSSLWGRGCWKVILGEFLCRLFAMGEPLHPLHPLLLFILLFSSVW